MEMKGGCRLIDVRPADVLITIEIPLKMADALVQVIDKCQVNYDSKNEEEVKQVEALKDFQGFLDETIEELKENVG
jgi:hypothetical protein